ncbi:hypothetical protein GGF50DRAFT_41578 [Schizophyllum commune]
MSGSTQDKVLLDDQSINVTYTGSWRVGGTPDEEYAGTVSSSTHDGDYFEVEFSGWLIAVYGTFDYSSDWVQTSYSIDGGNATTVTSHSGTGDTYKQLFWKSDNLVQGDHTLKVTMEHVNTGYEDGEGTIWFDFFEIYGGDNSTSSATGSSSEPTSQRHRRHPNVSAIIGGVVGGVLLVCVSLILGVMFARKRKARKQTKAEACDSIDYMYPANAAEIVPFVSSTSQSSGPRKAQHASSDHGPWPAASYPDTSQTFDAPSTRNRHDVYHGRKGGREVQLRHNDGLEESTALPPVDVVRHTDSGIRGLELPPVYTAD